MRRRWDWARSPWAAQDRCASCTPLSGDEFTLFPEPRRAPPPIDCDGSTEEHFACLAKQAERASEELGVAGGFAAVTADGTIHAFARGDALNQGAAVIDQHTRFPVGSVTKMFVAADAVSRALEGALDLHQPIARYRRRQEPPWSPPGALFNYSNLGYTFAAPVLERVTGKAFEQVVQERVLLPAGITGADFGPERATVRGHAQGPAAPRCRGMWPSAGLLLSLRELAQWAHVFARPEALPLGAPLAEQLTALHVPFEDGPRCGYGYGVRRFEHGCVQICTRTRARLEPDSRIASCWGRSISCASRSRSCPGGSCVLVPRHPALNELLLGPWCGP